MSGLAALLAGTMFGVGLVVSGMSDPLNVIAFLRLAPGWNPALLLVMGSALVVTAVGYKLLAGRSRPLLGDGYSLPTATAIDGPLIGGAALFGAGWGLAGFCPGPALVSAALLDERGLIFVAAFLVGTLGQEATRRRRAAAGALTDG